jgi:hypothetical protein
MQTAHATAPRSMLRRLIAGDLGGVVMRGISAPSTPDLTVGCVSSQSYRMWFS